MNDLKLTIALPDYDHTRDLAMGRVRTEGIQLSCLILPVEEIFYRMIMYREFDASELSFAKYASMRASGDDSLIALPVFPARMFRHASLFVRRDGPIKAISELKGRRVGLPEWAQTAAVYSRGFLVQQFGIDLASIDWVQAGTNQPGRIEKVDLQLPKGVRLTRVADKSLNEMLLSGEIDAALSARPPAALTHGHPNIKRFFDDVIAVETEYYRKTGIYPIMHVFAVRREILETNPWAARSLFDAFEEAKARSIERALDGTVSLFPIPWGFEHARRGMELLGADYFPYGVEPNRKTIEAFLAYAHEQGVCKKRMVAEDIFPKQMFGTHRV